MSAGLALAVLPAVANAQGISLAVGNTEPAQNLLRHNLPGTDGDPDNSCRVEIRQAWTGGIILAPSNGSGQVDTFNPLVTNSYLGHGAIGSNPGLYSETFADRSVFSTNATYYARVFDRPDPAAAIYYADTALFARPPDSLPSINPEFGELKSVSGLDTDEDGIPDAMEDTDGDGIPDEMEGTTNTDPTSSDTDGDGYNDWFEAHYNDYLSPTEPDPSLVIQINPPPPNGVDPHTVSWWTIPVPGMTYLLDYRPQWVDGDAFSNLWSGTATDTNVEIDVEGQVQTDGLTGFFRVVVPYEGP